MFEGHLKQAGLPNPGRVTIFAVASWLVLAPETRLLSLAVDN